MKQQTRNIVAKVMAAVLVPVMIYLFVTNIREARRRRGGPVAAPALSAPPSAMPPGAGPAVLPAPPPPPVNTVDESVAREQKKIAALLPGRNPFYPPSPDPASALTDVAVAPVPAAAAERPLTVTGIIFAKTRDRRMAVINGKMLGEGKWINGFQIVEIGTDEVGMDPRCDIQAFVHRVPV